MKKNKTAAMEMSIGTIVTIVLLMTTLVLGLILVRTVFSSAKGAIGLTDQQLTNEIGKAFGSEEDRVSVYPKSGRLTIKQEQKEAIGIGIRNLLEGVSGTQRFSYSVKVAESKCGNVDVLNWIEIGRSESNISINVGDYYATKIYFQIPTGSPLCTVKYRVEVTTDRGQIGRVYPYDSISFIVTSKAR